MTGAYNILFYVFVFLAFGIFKAAHDAYYWNKVHGGNNEIRFITKKVWHSISNGMLYACIVAGWCVAFASSGGIMPALYKCLTAAPMALFSMETMYQFFLKKNPFFYNEESYHIPFIEKRFKLTGWKLHSFRIIQVVLFFVLLYIGKQGVIE